MSILSRPGAPICLVVLAIFATFFNVNAYGKAPSDRQYLPVIVLTAEDGSASSPVTKQVIESISEQLRRAVLTVYSEELYGSGVAFRKRPFRSGALGVMGRSFQHFDRNLSTEVQSGRLGGLMAQLPAGSQRFWVETFWVKAPHNFPVIRDKISGAATMGILWNMAKSTASPEKSAMAESIVTGLTDIAVVNSKDLPGGRGALYAQGTAVYNWLADGNQQNFLPAYAAFVLDISSQNITVDLAVNVKPGELNLPLDPPDASDLVSPQALIFQPPHYVADPALGRFRFHRSYRRDGSGRPLLTISFGRMNGGDIRSVTLCSLQCAELEANGAAKHIKRSAPTAPGKMHIPETLEKRVGQRISQMIDGAVNFTNGYVDLFVMMQEITFDLGNPAGPTVVPELTRIPLVVRTTDPLGNQIYVDVTQNRYGIDFMKKMVVNMASDQLTETVRRDISTADEKGNKKFGEMADLLKTLFR
jgi:hypothetical protein